MKGKIIRIARCLLAVLLFIIFLIIIYNKTIGIPWKLFRKLPLTVSMNLELSDKSKEFAYRDRYFAYLYRYPDNCTDLLRKYAIDNSRWTALPAAKELNALLIDCFEWPIQNVGFLKGFDLSSDLYTGFWYYSRGLNDLNSYFPLNIDYYRLGTHELIVNIENHQLLIYIWLHQ